MSSKTTGFVLNASDNLDSYQKLIKQICEIYSKNMVIDELPPREELGLLLIKSKEHYKHHIVLAAVSMLIDLASAQSALSFQQLVESHQQDGSFVQLLQPNDQCRYILQSSETILVAVNALALDRVWEKSMLLNGDELKTVFRNVPPGTVSP